MYYYTIKRIIRMLTAAILALVLSACSFRGKVALQPTETTSPLILFENGENSKNSSLPSEAAVPQISAPSSESALETIPADNAASSFELTGPWHLDEQECDSDYLADSFPGYAEWGASMEIRSNGQISWYIGAESWTGTYALDNNGLHANMTADLDRTEEAWYFLLVEGSGNASLTMDYQGTALVWIYGDQGDMPAGEGGS